MKKINSVIKVLGLVVKYSAIVVAIIKGLQVAYDEVKKIDLDDLKTDAE